MRLLTLASLVALLVMPASQADDRPAQTAASAPTTKPDPASQGPDQSIAKKYQEILAEFEAEQIARRRVLTKAQSTPAKPVISEKRPRDLIVHYARRMVDLALSSPADPGARDALLWVIDKPGRGDGGPYGDEFARAAALLVRHHGDDPEAVRIGLRLDNRVTPRRDALLFGFYAAAKGREAKGLARLALAQYLAQKATARRVRPQCRGAAQEPRHQWRQGGTRVRFARRRLRVPSGTAAVRPPGHSRRG